MARRRKPGSMRSKLSVEEKIKIINDYMAETGEEEVHMRKVAHWARQNGRWPDPPAFDPVQAAARELSAAAREEY